MKFSELFDVLPNGNVSPKEPIRIGGIFMGTGSTLSRNININGINLEASWDKEVIAETVNGVVMVERILS